MTKAPGGPTGGRPGRGHPQSGVPGQSPDSATQTCVAPPEGSPAHAETRLRPGAEAPFSRRKSCRSQLRSPWGSVWEPRRRHGQIGAARDQDDFAASRSWCRTTEQGRLDTSSARDDRSRRRAPITPGPPSRCLGRERFSRQYIVTTPAGHPRPPVRVLHPLWWWRQEWPCDLSRRRACRLRISGRPAAPADPSRPPDAGSDMTELRQRTGRIVARTRRAVTDHASWTFTQRSVTEGRSGVGSA